MISKKLMALIMALIMMAALIAGCSGGEEKPDDDTQEEQQNTQQPENEGTEQPEEPADTHDDTLILAMASEPTTLNPYDHAAVTSSYMNQLTYNKLFRLDVDTLEPVCDLCESYENIDELTWRFKLKEGVKFHDGSELTAEDVKASLEYARTFTASDKYTKFWSTVTALDTHTVEIKTHTPYALILNDLSTNGNTILPKALIDSGNDFNINPIGTGPYKYVEWTLGEKVTFVKNEDYFDKDHQPHIANLVWKIIPEGTSRTIALEAGEIDMIIDVDTNDISRMEENEDISVLSVPGTRMAFFGLNNERAPFDNIDFRRAIMAAIDRQAVMEVAVNGQGSVTTSPNPQTFQGANEEGAIGYDVEAAKQYLAASGVDVSSLSFTCMTYTDETRRTAEVIQAYLQELGIHMEIESLDFAAWLERLLAGDFDTSVGGYTASDLLTYMKGMWHSISIGASNLVRLNDPEIDSLIEEAEKTLDSEARTQLLSDICTKINEKSLMVSLYTTTYVRAYNSDLQGMDCSAAGYTMYQDLYWAE